MNKWGKKNDVYLFDRDPKYFTPILFYMRTGKFTYNEKVLYYLALNPIIEFIIDFYQQMKKEISNILKQKIKAWCCHQYN